MAAPPFENPLPSLSHNSLFFDIYTDGAVAVPAPVLPGGPCGFVDLTPGANGARCGCRRFWGRPLPANQVRAFADSPGPDQAYWCMCSHHACYHEDVQAAQTPVVAAAPANPVAAGQENERPRGNREPLTPVQDMVPFQMPSAANGLGLSMEMPGFHFGGPSSRTTTTPDHAPAGFPPPSTQGLGSKQASAPATHQASEASLLPDTLSWANFPQSNNGASSGLPPIPSQCLLQSQSPSTAASSQIRYLRPFAGKGLHTLKGKAVAETGDVALARDMDGPHSSPGDNATVPNTQASPQDCLPMPTAPTPKVGLSQSLGSRPICSQEGFGRDLQSLKDTVTGHGQRLDKLENPSFSVAGHDDCADRHEHNDLRVTELESRVEEVEKRLNDDNSTVISSVRRDDGSVSSGSHFTHAFSDRQVYSQLQELQAQVNRLQASSLPTYNSPWELEVVILPFPLKGIWMPAHDFHTTQRASGTGAWDGNGDEWTQMPNTHSRQTPDPTSPYIADWLDQSPSCTWLLPRACAPGRIIDNRLRSRGLIKTLSVKGSDARSVHLAVADAFSNVLQILHSGIASHPSGLARAKVDKFLGLSQPWVPLRKLHKDSRLRFLSPAEMLTPALWDVGFLSSSVVMKATGMHRLYVTQPEAYLQDHPLQRESGWSWQKLRNLGRVLPDSQGSSASTVDASVENEECWRWHDRLDEAPVAPSPIPDPKQEPAAAVVANRSRSTAASSSQVFYTAQSPTAVRGKSPAVVSDQRRGSRPPHLRTSSVPVGGVPTLSSPGPGGLSGKSRVTSYSSASKSSPYERRPSPFVAGTGRPSPRMQMASAMVTKRRRSGGGAGRPRSPSTRQRNTPRWSTASFSRSPSVMPRGLSVAPEDQRMRGTTPFCYATPYSTAPMDPSRTGDHGRRASSVGPSAQVVKAHNSGRGMRHNDDDDEDMDYEDYDDDHGSRSDPYDDHDMMNHGSDVGFDGEDGDINVYEDGHGTLGDFSDEENESDGSCFARRRRSAAELASQQPDAQVLPEDEPWPGIEDNMSDGENVDPARLSSGDDVVVELEDMGDAASDVSSQPSEYPSTQRAWHLQEAGLCGAGRHRDAVDAGFKIHEDDDAGDGGGAATRW